MAPDQRLKEAIARELNIPTWRSAHESCAPRTDLQPPNAPTVNDLVVEPLINKPLVAQRTGRTPRWVEQEMLRGLPHYKLGSRTAFLWSG